jgi:4-hydroxy-tetrahydrodipicolinate synthase
MENKFGGVITALVTPFQDGEVDFDSLGKLLKFQLDQGVNGFVVNGTTAESPTLSRREVWEIFEFVKSESGGQAKLIVGTGSNSTAQTIEFTREAGKWGADAALVVVPYYNKPPQRGMLAHYKEVAKASLIPVIAYNVPSRTVAALDPETVGYLSRVDNIAGIKDATGSMDVLRRIRDVSAKSFALLSGDDGTCVDFCAKGGHGVIGVASHIIGRDMGQFMERAQAGDLNADAEYQQKYAEFFKHLYIEANPIPVKMALYWMGLIATPDLRLPLVPLEEKFHKDFKACLKNLALI